MHVLTILDHPDPKSLSRAVAERFMAGAEQSGHSTELADLHAEGFDPRWSMPDTAQFKEQPDTPPDVRAEQRRIERCDALAMVFPLYWWGMPAMLKGWIDRVFAWGWAYNQVGDPDPLKSMLRPRSCVMLIPAGANPDRVETEDLNRIADFAWQTGTMGYMGMTERKVVWLFGSEGSEDRRAGLLQKAQEAGRQIAAPARIVSTP